MPRFTWFTTAIIVPLNGRFAARILATSTAGSGPVTDFRCAEPACVASRPQPAPGDSLLYGIRSAIARTGYWWLVRSCAILTISCCAFVRRSGYFNSETLVSTSACPWRNWFLIFSSWAVSPT